MILFIFVLLSLHSNLASCNEKHTVSATKNFLIGAASGTIGTLILEPLVYTKNTLQQRKPLSKNIKVWYRGLFINASGSIPTLAFQNMFYGKFNQHLKTKTNLSTFYTDLYSALAAGGIAGIITCPRELLIIQQQNNGGNFYNLIKSFVHEHGVVNLFRGATPSMLRTSSYATFLFVATPKIKEKIQRTSNNPVLLNIGAPALAGMTSALLTHPLDTIKTNMQANLNKLNTLQSAKQLCLNNSSPLGILTLYKGLFPRLLGVAGSIVIVSNARNYIMYLTENIN